MISVLGHRNAVQRKQIRQAYEDLYQEDLIKRLESELSGDLEVRQSLLSSFFSLSKQDFWVNNELLFLVN